MEDSQRRDAAYRAMGNIIIESVGEMEGVPGGTLYAAAYRRFDIGLTQFEWLMSSLVERGKLEKRGELYFAKVTK